MGIRLFSDFLFGKVRDMERRIRLENSKTMMLNNSDIGKVGIKKSSQERS
jgi:predicted P-loop ATPase/GTPase